MSEYLTITADGEHELTAQLNGHAVEGWRPIAVFPVTYSTTSGSERKGDLEHHVTSHISAVLVREAPAPAGVPIEDEAGFIRLTGAERRAVAILAAVALKYGAEGVIELTDRELHAAHGGGIAIERDPSKIGWPTRLSYLPPEPAGE